MTYVPPEEVDKAEPLSRHTVVYTKLCYCLKLYYWFIKANFFISNIRVNQSLSSIKSLPN